MSGKMSGMKRDFIWNTAGSLVYALSSMCLAFFVMHAAGAEDGGIFGFGFSTFGQQMFIVSYFGIRPFQITDAAGSYTFGEYRRLRFLTAGLAVLLAAGYLGWMQMRGTYSHYKAGIIFLLALYKVMDGVADVYESECQRAGSLYVGGQGLFFRTVCTSLVLCAALVLTGSLMAAAFAAVTAQMIGWFCFNVRRTRSCAARGGWLLVRRGKVWELFQNTWLLFFSVFLDFYVFSASKYAVDAQLGDAANGVFNLLFMPTSVIYLVANFVIKPYMTPLAKAYETHDGEGVRSIYGNLTKLILLLTLAACIGVLMLGRPVLLLLEWLLGASYRGMLSSQLPAFFLIILGGGLYALANLSYYLLVIEHRQKVIFGIYAVAAVLAFAASGCVVPRFGIFGAAAVYAVLMGLLTAGFRICGRLYLK